MVFIHSGTKNIQNSNIHGSIYHRFNWRSPNGLPGQDVTVWRAGWVIQFYFQLCKVGPVSPTVWGGKTYGLERTFKQFIDGTITYCK